MTVDGDPPWSGQERLERILIQRLSTRRKSVWQTREVPAEGILLSFPPPHSTLPPLHGSLATVGGCQWHPTAADNSTKESFTKTVKQDKILITISAMNHGKVEFSGIGVYNTQTLAAVRPRVCLTSPLSPSGRPPLTSLSAIFGIYKIIFWRCVFVNRRQ